MISKLEIKNFRLFADFQITGLTRVNLFVGLNNSGKSSLLEAIYALANRGTPDTLVDLWEHLRELVSFRLNEPTPEGRFYELQRLFHRNNGDSTQRAEIKSVDSNGTKKYLCIQNQFEEEHSNGIKVINRENEEYVVDMYGTIRTTRAQGENGRGYEQTLRSQNIQWLFTRHLDYPDIIRLWNTIDNSPG